MHKVALIGFGEVGQTLAEDLLGLGQHTVAAYDILFSDSDSAPSKACGRLPSVALCASAAEAVRDADTVICAVTAERTGEAAAAAAQGLKKDTWFVDLNSASPGTKIAAAQAVNGAGGRYVETSVMSPIGPKRLASPLLGSGDYAADFVPVAKATGMAGYQHFSDVYGQASAAKMCRSVIVKGVESLITEALTTAHHYGVEDTVVKSLSDLFPGLNWQDLSSYMISRALIHGRRRAEEMREVAATVAGSGLEPLLSDAIAKRQDWSADLAVSPDGMDLHTLLETINKKKEDLS